MDWVLSVTLFISYTFDDPSGELNIGVFGSGTGSTGWSSAPSQTFKNIVNSMRH